MIIYSRLVFQIYDLPGHTVCLIPIIKAGAACAPKEGDSLARLPCLRTWFRTRSAICLWLSNGTIQINWFESHDKVVFCPKMEAITMLLSDGNSITFKTKLIAEHGITE